MLGSVLQHLLEARRGSLLEIHERRWRDRGAHGKDAKPFQESRARGCTVVLGDEQFVVNHLLPFDQHSGTCNFPLGGAVALAPCAPGAALAWHGSSVHWGGACSSHAEAEPRASLTAVLRLRSAPRTQLQSAQELPELEASALPLSLGARVRYVASALLVYSYWYSLGHGVLPPDMLEDD